MNEIPICPLCQSSNTQLFFQSQLNWSLRSDWTALPARAEVFMCTECSHLFKPQVLTKKWSDYQNYHVLENNPELDKLEFGTSMPMSRSSTIIDFLRKEGYLKNDSKVLDYGCNRGAFLKRLDLAKCGGYDVSEHYRPVIEGLGYSYYTPQLPPPKNEYDILTLIHVAEHLDPLAEAMKHGLASLKPNGVVFIQVPDIATQATDFYVMDHCSHFSPNSLNNMMAQIGLENIHAPSQILNGELTAAYKKTNKTTSPTKLQTKFQKLTSDPTASLKQGETMLLDLLMKNEPYVVYGAGLLGSLVGRVLDSQLNYFIDDNTELQGKKNLNKLIKSFDSFREQDGTLVVAVPPSAAARVEDKCKKQGLKVVVPFRV